jgi:hypothetical protein
MVFFHRHFIFLQKFKNEKEKYLTCAACIFLSIKVLNQLIPLKDLITLFLKLYNKQNNLPLIINDQILFEEGEKLCKLEFDILNSIGFDMNIDLPYKYVHLMKFYFLEYLKNSKLIIITTNFISDSFKLPLILFYEPLLIALASLYLLSVYFNVQLVDSKEGIKWYHLVDNTIELNDIKEVSEKINEVYKFCIENKTDTIRKIAKLQDGTQIIKFEVPIIENCLIEDSSSLCISNCKNKNENTFIKKKRKRSCEYILQSNLDVTVCSQGNFCKHQIPDEKITVIPDPSVNLLEQKSIEN